MTVIYYNWFGKRGDAGTWQVELRIEICTIKKILVPGFVRIRKGSTIR